MIKGKVSQTIEDIKSSKAGNISSSTSSTGNISSTCPTVIVKGAQSHQLIVEPDTDIKRPHSFGEDLSLAEHEQHRPSIIGSGKQKRHNKTDEWNRDFESEILLDFELEQSRLKRGFANLKSKVKSKQPSNITVSGGNSGSTSNLHTLKKDISPSRSTGSSSSTSSLRQSFLRRRRNQKDSDTAEPSNNNNTGNVSSSTSLVTPLAAAAAMAGATVEMAAAMPVVVHGKPDKKTKNKRDKEIEIESGVEMLEDTIPSPANTTNGGGNNEMVTKKGNKEQPVEEFHSAETLDEKDADVQQVKERGGYYQPSEVTLTQRLLTSAKYLPSYSLLALAVVLISPMNDFIRGVLACLLFIAVTQGFTDFLATIIENFLLTYKPERAAFVLPDYRRMSVCEVPPIKEFKTMKNYEGWMNEIETYDPETFLFSSTHSVYIKLEGSILHVSSTNARIPKRVIWNEKPIDLKTITFTSLRTYNLANCRIELLPVGLARKRHFNRKYPIQLIVQKSQYNFINLEPEPKGTIKKQKAEKAEKVEKAEKAEKPKANTEAQTVITNDHERKSMDQTEIDFGDTLLNADFQTLQDELNPDEELKNLTVPSGEEVRLLLFARAAREKEDWFRHFIAARDGDINEKDLRLRTIRFVNDSDLQAAAQKVADSLTQSPKDVPSDEKITGDNQPSTSAKEPFPDNPDRDEETEMEDDFIDLVADEDIFEGLIMTSCAARCDPEYLCFMSLYQKACNQTRIPVYKRGLKNANDGMKHRKRSVRNQNELWKSIDQSLFLGPSGSVVWANVLVGRMLFSVLHNDEIVEKIKEFFQKKINAIRLPGFIESVTIKHIDLGNKPPLIHRVSQPLIDERGVWVDADLTYDGLFHVTVTTKLNLLRLKRPAPARVTSAAAMNVQDQGTAMSTRHGLGVEIYESPSASAIYDSDAESTGSSSTESEKSIATNASSENLNAAEGTTSNAPGNARRIFKFVDRFAASNFFHYATEIPYVQKTLENMNTTITLELDGRGLVGRGTVNIPPPPSDRIWVAFRTPPRLWLTARPTVGEKSMDWSIVTSVIESKLCEAVSKYLVVPNMADITVPFLGKAATESCLNDSHLKY